MKTWNQERQKRLEKKALCWWRSLTVANRSWILKRSRVKDPGAIKRYWLFNIATAEDIANINSSH